MLVFEAKLEGKSEQYERLDEAIRTARFIRNSCIRYWMDTPGVGRYDLSAYCVVLAKEFPWASKLNSMARQASAERAWSAIERTHICPHCGFVLDRDWNAARNILELGLRTVGHTETSNASGDIDKSLNEETLLNKSDRRKRKPKQ